MWAGNPERASHVSGEAEPLTAWARERETGGGQLGLTPVAGRDVPALDADLADLARLGISTVLAEDPDSLAGHRVTEGHHGVR
jgi:hypothetical protein